MMGRTKQHQGMMRNSVIVRRTAELRGPGLDLDPKSPDDCSELATDTDQPDDSRVIEWY